MTVRSWLALATVATLVSSCVANPGSDPAADSPTVASQGATIDEPEPGDPSDVTYLTYLEWEDAAFTVIVSAEADALFEDVKTCTSEEGGYTVEFPSNWHTNEGGQAPACSWFGPEPFAHAPATLVAVRRPLNVPIQLGVWGGALGQVLEQPRLVSDQVVIGGFEGFRSEVQIQARPPWWSYTYNAWLDLAFDGLKFMASTTSAADGDYVLHKAVLDRMMATLEFASRPEGANHVAKEGYPFTVLDSADADRLFETPDTCTNPIGGYTVTFPDDWYTNTAIGETPACSWFTPDYFEVIDPAEAPDEIWISTGIVDGIIAYTGLTQIFLNEEVLVGGMQAHRAEFNHRPNDRPNYRVYHYAVTIGSPDQGPSFLASVDPDAAGDYELAKAVLDRIMASLEFDE